MAVGALEHDGEIVLDHSACGGHGVFAEGRGEGEGFVGKEVGHSVWGGAVEGGVALGEIGAAV